jgi:hypothetical protein
VFLKVSDGFDHQFVVKRVVQVVTWALQLDDLQCRSICANLVTLVMSDGIDPT